MCAIISLAVIFGLLGFAYSFFSLLDETQNIVSLELFHLLTVNEIGGHFPFGVIVSKSYGMPIEVADLLMVVLLIYLPYTPKTYGKPRLSFGLSR